MLVSLFICAFLVESTHALWSLESAIYTNQTRTTPSGSLITSCPVNCYRHRMNLRHVFWSSMLDVTTLIAETHLVFIKKETNSTRTCTIYNTDIRHEWYTAITNAETNLAGTAIATVSGSFGNSTTYRTVAYPTTAYNDYESSYSFCGTLPTITGGSATCLAYQDCTFSDNKFHAFLDRRAPSFAFPSHPSLPEGIQGGLDTNQDPKGLTYQAILSDDCDDSDIIIPLFPNLGVWSCKILPGSVQQRASYISKRVNLIFKVKRPALYLTETSTLLEGGGPTPSGTLGSPQPLESPTVSIPMPTTSSTPIPNSSTSTELDNVPILLKPNSEGSVAKPATSYFAPFSTTVNAIDNALNKSEILQQASTTLPTIAVTNTDAQSRDVTTNTLAAAGEVDTISDTTISPSPNRTEAVVRASTQDSTSNLRPATSPPFSTIGPCNLAPDARCQDIVSSQSLTSSGILILPSIRISLAPSRPFADFETRTNDFAITSTPAIKIGSKTMSINTENQHIVDSQTLTSGGNITVRGTGISLASNGGDASVKTTTELPGGSDVVGSAAGINGSANSTTLQAFTGGAQSKHRALCVEAVLLGLGMAIVIRF